MKQFAWARLSSLLVVLLMGTVVGRTPTGARGLDPIPAPNEPGTYLLNVAGGGVVHLGDQFTTPSWSPDGSHLAVAGIDVFGSPLLIIDRDGTVTTVPNRGPGYFSSPSWSPDSSQVAALYVSPPTAGADVTGLYLVSANGTQRQLLRAGLVFHFAWAPDGSALAVETDAFSGPDNRTQVDLIDAATGAPTATILAPTTTICIDGLAWSPDGGYLAYTTGGIQNDCEPPENDGLWIWSSADSKSTLVQPGFFRAAPIWAGENRVLLPQSPALVVNVVDGSTVSIGQPVKATCSNRSTDIQTAGGVVLYGDDGGQLGRIFIASATGGAPRLLSDPATDSMGGALSADGAQVAWVELRDNSASIVVAPATGSAAVPFLTSTQGLRAVSWSPTGDGLIFRVLSSRQQQPGNCGE